MHIAIERMLLSEHRDDTQIPIGLACKVARLNFVLPALYARSTARADVETCLP